MRALIWQGREPKDLNDFVRDPSPFAQLLAAYSISDAGQIVGIGVTTTGDVHAFLASPRNGESFPPSTPGMYHQTTPEVIRALLRNRFGDRRR